LRLNEVACDDIDLLRDLRMYDRDLPIVICTANARADLADQFVQGHVTKPYDPTALRQMVARVTRRNATTSAAQPLR
jgi:CheY-like chemotaxis protein